MRKLFKSIVLALGMLTLSLSIMAQGVTKSATASATIITPITLTKTADMVFGNVAVGTGGGTLTLTTAGARSSTGDVSFQSAPAGAAAAFDITGTAGAAFAFTVPAAITIISGGNNMSIATTTNLTSPSTIAGGNVTLLIGGTLTVAGNQPAGAYTANFNVTVSYN